MDKSKVQAVAEWRTPKKVPELRSFLGFVNYYRRFIAGYSKRATPLTELLKKEQPWKWSDKCEIAFQDLKAAVLEEPVLKLPNYGEPFEVHTDASDFAIGGVLMQEGHPVAYESRKLNETERRYPVHEKEMTAVIHCLRVWRHYLLGSRFVLRTDNIALSYFQTQKKLSPKQARWQDFLAEFDMAMEYKPGKANVVADALSRKVECVNAAQLEGRGQASQLHSNFLSRIRDGLYSDPQAVILMQLIKEGKARRFWVQEGLVYTKGNRVYVPRVDNLRRELLKECHDSLWAGHPGIHRTLALVERAFYWPKMGIDVEEYVRTCLTCQQDKVEQRKPVGLLEPLPVPERPWESISLDFISSLPPVGGLGSILVVVDRFSKYATFIAAPLHCSAEEAARLMMKGVVKYWGVPHNIISDRDARFLGRFWTELFKLLGSKLYFSTSLHPQTDGQTERINSLLEQYLRHYVSANQRDWVKLLDIAQFSYNLQRSSASNKSPFEIITGQQPSTPHTMAIGYTGSSPSAYHFAKEWHRNADIARAYLEKAAKRMKKWADLGRRPQEFKVGDLVLVKLQPASLQFFRKRVHKGLVRKYEGPFPIISRVGNVSYKLQLPAWFKIHNVLHASNLKAYHSDPQDASRSVPTRLPPITASYEKRVETILADRKIKLPNGAEQTEYLVKWRKLPRTEASWEPEDALRHEEEVINNYQQASTRASTV